MILQACRLVFRLELQSILLVLLRRNFLLDAGRLDPSFLRLGEQGQADAELKLMEGKLSGHTLQSVLGIQSRFQRRLGRFPFRFGDPDPLTGNGQGRMPVQFAGRGDRFEPVRRQRIQYGEESVARQPEVQLLRGDRVIVGGLFLAQADLSGLIGRRQVGQPGTLLYLVADLCRPLEVLVKRIQAFIQAPFLQSDISGAIGLPDLLSDGPFVE